VKRLFLLVFFMNILIVAFAQVTDEQVVNMLQNARQQGMGQEEMLLMLSQKGVTQEQLMRIKENYGKNLQISRQASETTDRMRKEYPEKTKKTENSKIVKNSKTIKNNNEDKTEIKEELLNIKESEDTFLDSLFMAMTPKEQEKEKKKLIFGHNIFNNELLTFEPNLNIATPENYILGPGDEVIVDIWGDAEQTFRQRISPDGSVTDAKIGPIYLSGISIKAATARLKNAFARIYATMRGEHPTTFMSLSLGEIRSIRVNVMGEVEMPGTYTLPSLASLFHAIYSAGGVNEIGSLRIVKVSRGGKELGEIDVYNYLLKGQSNMDIRLQDGDVVIVPPYQNLVTLEGKVKRPLIYEMKDNEDVKQLLDYAGGFTGDAYKKAVRVVRKSGREYQIFNVENTDFGQFSLTDGDVVSVDSVINRFENRIEVRGAVYREGLYALGNVTTVKQLIEKAEGVRGDAFMNRAVIYREKPDRTQEVLAVDVKGVLNGESADVALQNNDVLYIPSIFDLKEDYTIKIDGAVGFPGTYRYAEGMSVEDLIIQSGGLKESASEVKIDVARRIKDPKSTQIGDVLAENYTLTLKEGLCVDGMQKFTLEPFDEVFVRYSPGYQEQQNVRIVGEVLFGGDYVLAKKGERLSDLVKRAGGLTSEAYAESARLTRKMSDDERTRVESLLKLTKQSHRDSVDINRLDIGDEYYVGIQLSKALKNPGSEYDVILREGDVLTIPQYTETVKISGAVMYPNTVVYKKGADLKHYIEQGGGFADRAKKRKVFIVYMNGTVSMSKTFAKAKAAPGCEIVVPVKPPRKGVGLAEIMSIASSTTSMAALVTSIINSTK